MSKELVVSDQDQLFIDTLLDNGGNVKQAAVASGHHASYGYIMRKRLASEIAEATQHYLAFHGPKAAHKIIGIMDDEMPNPVQLAAARDILDRAGIKTKDEGQQVNVKANIFILPEKKMLEAKIIDMEP